MLIEVFGFKGCWGRETTYPALTQRMKEMRLFALVIVLAIVLALPATFISSVDYELAVAEQMMVELGPWTQAAAKRWPKMTTGLAHLYSEQLEKAIAAGGERTVPITHELMENGSMYFDFSSHVSAFSNSAKAGWNAAAKEWYSQELSADSTKDISYFGKAKALGSWFVKKTTKTLVATTEASMSAWEESEPLTSFQRGLATLQAISLPDGGSFLDQFTVLPDGTVVRSKMKTAANVAEFFFVSGLITVDRKIASGEEIAPSEAASAALETTLFLGGTVKAISGGLRVTKTGSRAGKVAKAARTSGRLAKTVALSRTGRMAVAAGALVLCATHPGVINGLLEQIAHLTGYSVFWTQYLGWCAILCTFLLVFSPICLWLLPLAVWTLKQLSQLCELTHQVISRAAGKQEKFTA